MDKKYKTRGGEGVTLYEVTPLLIFGRIGPEPESWDVGGCYLRANRSSKDLVEVKPRVTQKYWANIYPNEAPSFYLNKTTADCLAGTDRMACVEIEFDFEEGEGL